MSEDTRQKTVWGDVINPDMGEGRYQDTLRRFRQRIADGIKLDAADCNEMGAKSTSCTWGLCECDDESAYPDANDHIFPVDFLKRGRMTERDPPPLAHCPMDRGGNDAGPLPGHSGCFYRCRVFRPKPRSAKPPTREEALKLYDDRIAERETQFGKKTTADDGEDQWLPRGPRS